MEPSRVDNRIHNNAMFIYICDIVCISLEEIQCCTGLVLLDYFQDIFISCNFAFLGVSGGGRGLGDSLQKLALVFPFATDYIYMSEHFGLYNFY